MTATPPPIPLAEFGSTGRQVTRVGLGGEGVLRTFGREQPARAVIAEAMAQGVGYFDTARAYAESEKYLGSYWKSHSGARETVFHTGKSAKRDRDGALFELRQTLENLGTDYLDLWQIHDVRTMDDVAEVVAPGGAMEAFQRAKAAGMVRHLGVTGHQDPEVLTHCVRHWPVDSVLLPVNPVEGALGGFLTRTVPAALGRGLAIIGMKVFGGRGGGRGQGSAGNYLFPDSGLTPELLLRYALSQPVTAVIVGCSSPEHVRTMADAARNFVPMTPEERHQLEAAYAPRARELAFYRGTS